MIGELTTCCIMWYDYDCVSSVQVLLQYNAVTVYYVQLLWP